MTDSPQLVTFGIDVFIMFSKRMPGEAKLALAIKDELEQLGLQPLEYEHWAWLSEPSLAGSGSPKPDGAWGSGVDRAALRALFRSSAAVVYIAPLSGETSEGVEVELEELRACGSPTLLVYWSPFGWHPLLAPDRVAGLNLVWRTEARSAGPTDMAQDQATHVARNIAGACWLASVLRSLPRDTSIRRWLQTLAPISPHPLLRFRLTDADDVTAPETGPADLDTSARGCADECDRDELVAFVRVWRNGTDLLTERLASELSYELDRSVRLLHRFCEQLCQVATGKLPEVAVRPWEDQLARAATLVRLDRNDEAAELLMNALPHLPEGLWSPAGQLLAFAAKDDMATAIERLTQEIARESDPLLRAHLFHTRGAIRTNSETNEEAWREAIEDFTSVIEFGRLRLAGLLGRARCYARLEQDAAAIADFDAVLGDPLAAPRLSASAWLDRGGLHWKSGRFEQAIADWGEVIHIADAEPLQRFRALEVRGQVLEELGRWRLAADDYEAMTAYSSIDDEYRSELRQLV